MKFFSGSFNTLTFILLMWRIGRAPNSVHIYLYIQQDGKLHSLFISGNCSTCFGWYFHPSSGELCKVASCFVYEYIGILLGPHHVLHISRIKAKELCRRELGYV
jgi:hypothetical protein